MSESQGDRIERKLDLLMRHLGVGATAPRAAASSTAGPSADVGAILADITPATDDQLDDPTHGDAVVRNDPPRWKGAKMAGRKWSTLTAEQLDFLAGFHAWRVGAAEKDGKDPKWARLDAARCLGWAARVRSGYKPPEDDFGGAPDDDEQRDTDIPF